MGNTAPFGKPEGRAERLQAKGRFLANMSHEIRAPLNAVLGLAKIGMRDHSGSPAGENFGRIACSGEHLLGVINDIQDFSRIEAGKLKVEHKPFPLHATIDCSVSFVAGLVNTKEFKPIGRLWCA